MTALALGAWAEGTHYESAILGSLPHCDCLYSKRIGTDVFQRIEIPIPMVRRDALSGDEIKYVRWIMFSWLYDSKVIIDNEWRSAAPPSHSLLLLSKASNHPAFDANL